MLDQDAYERQLRQQLQRENELKKSKRFQEKREREYQELYRQAVQRSMVQQSRQRQIESRRNIERSRERIPAAPNSQVHMVHPAPMHQPVPEPELEGQLLAELEAHRVLYVVAPDKFERQLLKVFLGGIIWGGIVVSCILISVVDNVEGKNQNPNIQNHWLAILALGGFVALIEAVLIVFNKKLMQTILIFTSLNFCWYMILLVVFYAIEITLLWVITVIACVIEVLICMLFLQQKKKLAPIALLWIIPILIALRADGHIQDFTWVYASILPIAVCVLLLVLAIISIVFACQAHSQYRQIHMKTVGYIYNALLCLSITLSLATIIVRAILIDNSIYIAIPTAVYLIAFVIFTYIFRDQISLFDSEATTLAYLNRAERIKFERIQKITNFYKISDNWLTLNEAEANQHRRNSESRIREARSRPDCSICLTSKVCMTWMPCGHMVVCQQCGKYLMNHSKTRCVICKVKCEQVYHMVEDEAEGEKLTSNYYYKKK